MPRESFWTIDFYPAGQGWTGGFYVAFNGKPLVGPFDDDQEALTVLTQLLDTKPFSDLEP